ncbi:Modulator of FtsH protease HflK [compost metagenome]
MARFSKLLPEYKAAPEITRERLYIETMEKVLSHTRKVLVSDKGNNLMVLPLDQMLRGNNAAANDTSKNDDTGLLPSVPGLTSSNSKSSADNSSSRSSGSVMDQRRANAQRDDTLRVGRE